MLKKVKEETASLMAIYADRLEQMNQSHTALNQTVNDILISLQAFIDDAKKRAYVKETAKLKWRQSMPALLRKKM